MDNKETVSATFIDYKNDILKDVEKCLFDLGIARYDILFNNPSTGIWDERFSYCLPVMNEEIYQIDTIEKYSANKLFDTALSFMMDKKYAPISFLSKYFEDEKVINDVCFWRIINKKPCKITVLNLKKVNWKEQEVNWIKHNIIYYKDNTLFKKLKNEYDYLNPNADNNVKKKFEDAQSIVLNLMYETGIKEMYLYPFFLTNNITNEVKKTSIVAYAIALSTKENSDYSDLELYFNNYFKDYFLRTSLNLNINLKREIETAKKKIQKESIKTAVAAIMSRNMSHNLGSHYLTNTKNYLGKQAEFNNDADLRGVTHLLQYIQERMDYIATIVSNDKYPLGAVNFKSQLFDEFTIDDKGARHNKPASNFLLQYLVYSEKYTRYVSNNEHSVSKKMPAGFNELTLQIEYCENGGDIEQFTGKSDIKTKEKESNIKYTLSRLNLALPGGIMARHSIFNIIENIIRNSAKHSKTKNNLSITIRLNKIGNDKITIFIFDNKKNGKEIKEVLENRLKHLQILEPGTYELDKNNKGLKEILISALWAKNKNVSEVLSEIDSCIEEKKLEKIKNEAFEITTQDENLAYKFEFPLYNDVVNFKNGMDLLDIHADIVVCSDKETMYNDKKLSTIFTRLYCGKIMNNVTMLKKCIEFNLDIEDIDTYSICIEKDGLDSKDYVQTLPTIRINSFENNSKNIIFKNHFYANPISQKFEIINETYKDVPYIDSISGENFVSTLIAPLFLNDSFLRYKVIESALTKIAIIDERIFEKFHYQTNIKEENISRIENIIDKIQILSIKNILDTLKTKSWFLPEYEYELKLFGKKDNKDNKYDENTIIKREDILKIIFPITEQIMMKKNIYVYSIDFSNELPEIMNLSNKCISVINNQGIFEAKSIEKVHFLSIHLGLIEKYRDFKVRLNPTLNQNLAIEEIMTEIKKKFSDDGSRKVKIAIHSGRGNFSPELQDVLKEYPFITLSALEAALDNSKYLLSQLFYNTVFYGKGNLNNNTKS